MSTEHIFKYEDANAVAKSLMVNWEQKKGLWISRNFDIRVLFWGVVCAGKNAPELFDEEGLIALKEVCLWYSENGTIFSNLAAEVLRDVFEMDIDIPIIRIK
jgi:hypothetical protein